MDSSRAIASGERCGAGFFWRFADFGRGEGRLCPIFLSPDERISCAHSSNKRKPANKSTEKCDILITGDRNGFGERSLLRNAEIPEADILVAGHHGARSSTCQELLEAVKPEIVCISAGEGNPYGHPAPELLKRLTDFGCTVYRTDQNGTITIRR